MLKVVLDYLIKYKQLKIYREGEFAKADQFLYKAKIAGKNQLRTESLS